MKTLALRFLILLVAAMVCIVTAPCVCSAHAASVTAASRGCCPHCSKTTPTPVECPHCKGSAFEKTAAHASGPLLMPPVPLAFAESFSFAEPVEHFSDAVPTRNAFPPFAQTLLNQHCALTV